jgi:hypothetical protein
MINLLFDGEEYEVYYKHDGTLKEFLNYMSKLRNDREMDGCVCVDRESLEILSREMELNEIISQ